MKESREVYGVKLLVDEHVEVISCLDQLGISERDLNPQTKLTFHLEK